MHLSETLPESTNHSSEHKTTKNRMRVIVRMEEQSNTKEYTLSWIFLENMPMHHINSIPVANTADE